MAEIVLRTRFRLRRGTSEAWARVNPVLLYGEPGFEKDTNKLKIGDGVKAWNDLPYLTEGYSISADGKTITYNDNSSIELYGYSEAKVGQVPSKGENHLEWIDPSGAESMTEEDILDICKRKE